MLSSHSLDENLSVLINVDMWLSFLGVNTSFHDVDGLSLLLRESTFNNFVEHLILNYKIYQK